MKKPQLREMGKWPEKGDNYGIELDGIVINY
jgi:hypothetical protein